MNIENLTAISPVDGRYRGKTENFDRYFSEFGLIKYRVLVEIEYFIALSEIPLPQMKELDEKKHSELRKIYQGFELDEARKIKEIEAVTNHDVKAVEYFLKEKFDALGLEEYKEFIHFGLTSQDVNNTATPLSYKDAMEYVFYPVLDELIDKLKSLTKEWKDITMLAR